MPVPGPWEDPPSGYAHPYPRANIHENGQGFYSHQADPPDVNVWESRSGVFPDTYFEANGRYDADGYMSGPADDDDYLGLAKVTATAVGAGSIVDPTTFPGVTMPAGATGWEFEEQDWPVTHARITYDAGEYLQVSSLQRSGDVQPHPAATAYLRFAMVTEASMTLGAPSSPSGFTNLRTGTMPAVNTLSWTTVESVTVAAEGTQALLEIAGDYDIPVTADAWLAVNWISDWELTGVNDGAPLIYVTGGVAKGTVTRLLEVPRYRWIYSNPWPRLLRQRQIIIPGLQQHQARHGLGTHQDRWR